MNRDNDRVVEVDSVFSADGSKPLAQLLERVEVHVLPSAQSEAIFCLEAEDIVELHKLWKTAGGWVEIRMCDGSMGYMPSATKVNLLERVKLKADEAAVFEQPSADVAPVHKLVKGAMFWRFVNAPTADPQWVAVRFDSGQQGYIASSTKMASLTQPTMPAVESAGHDILVGALWCIGGIVVTAATYSAVAEGGGTYLVCWGAVIFGGLQFLRGLFRAVVAEQPPFYGREENEEGQLEPGRE